MRTFATVSKPGRIFEPRLMDTRLPVPFIQPHGVEWLGTYRRRGELLVNTFYFVLGTHQHLGKKIRIVTTPAVYQMGRGAGGEDAAHIHKFHLIDNEPAHERVAKIKDIHIAVPSWLLTELARTVIVPPVVNRSFDVRTEVATLRCSQMEEAYALGTSNPSTADAIRFLKLSANRAIQERLAVIKKLKRRQMFKDNPRLLELLEEYEEFTCGTQGDLPPAEALEYLQYLVDLQSGEGTRAIGFRSADSKN